MGGHKFVTDPVVQTAIDAAAEQMTTVVMGVIEPIIRASLVVTIETLLVIAFDAIEAKP